MKGILLLECFYINQITYFSPSSQLQFNPNVLELVCTIATLRINRILQNIKSINYSFTLGIKPIVDLFNNQLLYILNFPHLPQTARVHLSTLAAHLGARISENFTQNISHVFATSHGTDPNRDLALNKMAKFGKDVVDVRWLEKCRDAEARVDLKPRHFVLVCRFNLCRVLDGF